jgi:hypothetical protein
MMNRVSAGTGSAACPAEGALERGLGAIEDLAQYAGAQYLTSADELLTVLMAALFAPKTEPSHEQRSSSETRALNAVRVLCHPIESG